MPNGPAVVTYWREPAVRKLTSNTKGITTRWPRAEAKTLCPMGRKGFNSFPVPMGWEPRDRQGRKWKLYAQWDGNGLNPFPTSKGWEPHDRLLCTGIYLVPVCCHTEIPFKLFLGQILRKRARGLTFMGVSLSNSPMKFFSWDTSNRHLLFYYWHSCYSWKGGDRWKIRTIVGRVEEKEEKWKKQQELCLDTLTGIRSNMILPKYHLTWP